MRRLRGPLIKENSYIRTGYPAASNRRRPGGGAVETALWGERRRKEILAKKRRISRPIVENGPRKIGWDGARRTRLAKKDDAATDKKPVAKPGANAATEKNGEIARYL